MDIAVCDAVGHAEHWNDEVRVKEKVESWLLHTQITAEASKGSMVQDWCLLNWSQGFTGIMAQSNGRKRLQDGNHAYSHHRAEFYSVA